MKNKEADSRSKRAVYPGTQPFFSLDAGEVPKLNNGDGILP